MIRPPPRATLFPDPTLFQSLPRVGDVEQVDPVGTPADLVGQLHRLLDARVQHGHGGALADEAADDRGADVPRAAGDDDAASGEPVHAGTVPSSARPGWCRRWSMDRPRPGSGRGAPYPVRGRPHLRPTAGSVPFRWRGRPVPSSPAGRLPA